MSNITYDRLNEALSKNCKIVRYGKYNEEIDENGNANTKIVKSIDEPIFYKLYIELNNVIEWRRKSNEIINTKLSPTPLELLVHLLCKSSDFTIVFRNKDGKMARIAEELDKSTSSVYANIGKLRKAGYIVKDEDNLFTLSKEMLDLRNATKKAIEDGGALKFDFLFKFCVTNKE